jgi:hypothetical protein
LSELPECIFRHWIHSREEDTIDTMTYRPSEFKFPPSRGREGFEIKRSGEFILYGIGRDDRSKKIIGHYTVEGSNRLHIIFDDVQLAPFTVKILMCDEDVLRVEKRSM